MEIFSLGKIVTGGNPAMLDEYLNSPKHLDSHMFKHTIARKGIIEEKEALLTTQVSNGSKISYKRLTQKKVDSIMKQWNRQIRYKIGMNIDAIFNPVKP